MEKKRIFEIVLTGGPCSGKSSFLREAIPLLEDEGFKILVMCEVPVEVYDSGIRSDDLDQFDFRLMIMERILKNQENLRKVAKACSDKGQTVVIFYDRGLMDNKGFCAPDIWNKLLTELKISEKSINEDYDAVFNLETVAMVSRELWLKYGGDVPARYQKTSSEAKAREMQIQKDWGGHHNFIVFKNEGTNWRLKFERIFNAVCSVVGLEPEFDIDAP
jgi:predicted ATPase